MKRIDIIALAVLAFVACKTETKIVEPESVETNLIEISQEQFKAAKMKIGQPEIHVFNEMVNTNGYIKASSEGISAVQPKVSGWVRNLKFAIGQPVQKGDILFVLESNELIELQKSYAQSVAIAQQNEADLKRIQSLVDADVSAKKDLQKIKSDYQIALAEMKGLEARLVNMKLDINKVAEGDFVTSLPVKSDINGFVSKVEVVNGSFAEPNQLAVEIIDNHKLQLNLFVFEKDLVAMSSGQKVLFYDPDRKSQKYEATLKYIGKTINPESKTIQCLAAIENPEFKSIINGMFVEVSVITCEREAYALPADALIKDEFNTYVLVKESETDGGFTFRKRAVELGREEIDFSELLTTELGEVLITGVYNLSGEE